MSDNPKKNILIIILVSSVLLFLVAVYWKQNNNSNVEIITTTVDQNITVKDKKPKDLTFLTEDNFIHNNEDSAEEAFESSEETRKEISNVLNMHLMYKTPEQVMKAISFYQDRDEEQKADQLIEFLLDNFPDYDIPDNF